MKISLAPIILLLAMSASPAQEIFISEPSYGFSKENYSFDHKGEEIDFTVNCRGLEQTDTIFVIKDFEYPTEESLDTLLYKDFKYDTISWTLVVPQTSWFMVTFINRRTSTYVHALMDPPLLTIEDLDRTYELPEIYYDIQGRMTYKKEGILINSRGQKILFR